MSDLTKADLITGGSLALLAEKICKGHNHAAAADAFALGDYLNRKALEGAGGLNGEPIPDEDEWAVVTPPRAKPVPPVPAKRVPTSAEIASCAKGAHAFVGPDSRGWHECSVCGQVNVAGG